jgi:hypothetical protein
MTSMPNGFPNLGNSSASNESKGQKAPVGAWTSKFDYNKHYQDAINV